MNEQKNPTDEHENNLRLCQLCHSYKPISEYANKKKPNELRKKCEECSAELAIKYRKSYQKIPRGERKQYTIRDKNQVINKIISHFSRYPDDTMLNASQKLGISYARLRKYKIEYVDQQRNNTVEQQNNTLQNTEVEIKQN